MWRSRRYLEQLDSQRAKFSTHDAAAMAIRNELSLQGHSPADTADIGRAYASNVIYLTLMDGSGVCEVLAGSAERLDDVERLFLIDNLFISELSGVSLEVTPDRFLLVARSNEHASASDVILAQSTLHARSCALVDLALIGENFGLQAGRPLITLSYDGVTRGSSPPPRRRVIGGARKGAGERG